MPYSSKAQQRYFHYLESKGKLPKKTVKDYNESTEFDDLPESVDGYSQGGMIEPKNDYDWDMGHASEYDSSGEPHTEDELESEHPMEYMNRGGSVKKMNRGGAIKNPEFIKALRRAR